MGHLHRLPWTTCSGAATHPGMNRPPRPAKPTTVYTSHSKFPQMSSVPSSQVSQAPRHPPPDGDLGQLPIPPVLPPAGMCLPSGPIRCAASSHLSPSPSTITDGIRAEKLRAKQNKTRVLILPGKHVAIIRQYYSYYFFISLGILYVISQLNYSL